MVSVLVQLSAARQGSPLNNLQLSSFFFSFLSPVPTPSSQYPPHLPHPMWNVACLRLEPFAHWVWICGWFLAGICGCFAVTLGPGGLTVRKCLCMGIGDHGSAAGARLRTQPADGECSGRRWGPGAPSSSLCGIASHPCGVCCCSQSCRHVNSRSALSCRLLWNDFLGKEQQPWQSTSREKEH